MVTNVELDKEVDEKKRIMDDKSKILDEAIEEMRENLKEVAKATLGKEDDDENTNKERRR